MEDGYAYDGTFEHRLAQIAHSSTVTGNAEAAVSRHEYGYQFANAQNDPAGQIRQWTVWHSGMAAEGAGRRWAFEYDGIDQLTDGVQLDLDETGTPELERRAYDYDDAGNRIADGESSAGAALAWTRFGTNIFNQLTHRGVAEGHAVPVKFRGTVSEDSEVKLKLGSVERTTRVIAAGESFECEGTIELEPGDDPALEATERNVKAGFNAQVTVKTIQPDRKLQGKRQLTPLLRPLVCAPFAARVATASRVFFHQTQPQEGPR